jgi:predicted amidohydrolase YtcJ
VVKNFGAGTDSKGHLLSDDIFKIDPAKIRDVKVLKTIVGGKWVYEAK